MKILKILIVIDLVFINFIFLPRNMSNAKLLD